MKKLIILSAAFLIFVCALPAMAAWTTLYSQDVSTGNGNTIVYKITGVSNGSSDTIALPGTKGFYFYSIEVYPGTLGAAWDVTVTDTGSGATYLAKQALSQTADEIFVGSTTTGQFPFVSGGLTLTLDPDGDLSATNDVVIYVKCVK